MKKIFYLYILLWISVVLFSLCWHYYRVRKQTRFIAYEISKSFFDFVLLTREWNAMHGGVYVIVDNNTRPNPYLKDPLRDIKVSNNLILTKINPAYMTRQLSDLSEKERGVIIGIKSLNPLNPKNKPNQLEREALLSFKKGKKEFFKKVGNKYFYMSVLTAQKPCLKCHKNLKIGEMVGGISILIPFAPDLPIMPLAVGHFFIGLLGVIFIIYSGRKLERAYQEIEKQATYDGLTGIYNRRMFEEKIAEEVSRGKRANTPLSLIICDIDWFKKYNDTYGHRKGDICLKNVAEAIKKSLKRMSDFCARYGGEEFAVVLPNTNEQGAISIAYDIKKNIENLKIPHKASPINFITLSMGIFTVEDYSKISSCDDIVNFADNALYKAKSSGRNIIVVYET